MNKNRVLVVVALIVAVIGLGIGFAAFNASLTIDSGTTIEAQDSFQGNVKFVADTLNCTTKGNAELVGTPTINDTSISNLQIKFTGPGDSIECEISIKNESAFTAYLQNLTSSSNTISCTSEVEEIQGLNDACSVIGLTFAVMDYDAEESMEIRLGSISDDYQFWDDTIDGLSIVSGASNGTAYLELTYAAGISGNSSKYASDDFTITIPTLTANFSTVKQK